MDWPGRYSTACWVRPVMPRCPPAPQCGGQLGVMWTGLQDFGPRPGSRRSVEDIAQPGLFAMGVMPLRTSVVRSHKVRLGPSRRGAWRRGGGAINQFVEFAAIKPHAATLRAVVNFDTLAITHHQRGFGTGRAFHGEVLANWLCIRTDHPKQGGKNGASASVFLHIP